MLPTNGRNGYFIWSGEEIPIYSWGLSALNNRSNIRLSNSQNFPVRYSGIGQETLLIRGVDYIPVFYDESIITDTMNFDVGWMDFLTTLRRKINVSAMLAEYTVILNYMNSNLPSFSWLANFIGCLFDKEFDVENLDINDHVRCQTSLCDKNILTTDSTLNGGFVQHVRTANLIRMFDRPNLVLSNSDNHFTGRTGVFDYLVDLTIEGDFDYWLAHVSTDSRFDYRFHYTPVGYIPVNNMKVIEISNITVNVQTAEMISAVVRLGASYE